MKELNTKICPDCGAEFFPHVEKCSDCGTALAWKDSLEWERAKMATRGRESPDDGVAVRKGNQAFIGELSLLLTERGIANDIRACDDCTPGKCATTCELMVEKEQAQDAVEIIEAYFREQHPEMLLADERAAQNKCPACGFYVGPDAKECRDCGLPLLIEEQEE